jgi:hypothetical protein
MTKRPLHERSEYGSVVGARDGTTWMYYNMEDKEVRTQRRKMSKVTIQETVAEAVQKATVASKEETKAEVVQAALAACRHDFEGAFSATLPAVIKWTQENPTAMADQFPLPSFVGSNSVNIAAAPALATAPAPAPAPAPTPATIAHSSPSSVPGRLGGASTLAELDTLTVIMHRTLINILNLLFLCLSDL